MYKIRFHLASGKFYKHWQIKTKNKVVYSVPANTFLLLEKCKLRNQPATALKIHQGANRSVSGWIEAGGCWGFPSISNRLVEAEKISEITVGDRVFDTRIFYDPKIRPYWYDIRGNNLDNQICDRLVIINKNVYLPNASVKPLALDMGI